MIHVLYKTINLINGHFYVGVHSTEDIGFGTKEWIDPYIGSGPIVKRALKKYGRKNFLVEIIAYFDTEETAYHAEADIVTENWLETNKLISYNRTSGGNKPPKVHIWINNGIINKRIASNLHIPEGFAIGRLINYTTDVGKRRSIEAKQRMSLAAYARNPSTRNLSYKRTDETRKRMSEAAKRRCA